MVIQLYEDPSDRFHVYLEHDLTNSRSYDRTLSFKKIGMQTWRTAFILVFGGLVCWGCQDQPERVYVDLSLFNQMNQAGPARLTLQQPITTIKRQNALVLHSIPPPKTSASVQEEVLIRSIEEQKQLGYEKLSLRLQQIAEHESARIQRQEESALEAIHTKEREISWFGGRHLFEDLAQNAWPKWVRLSFLAGFPDPDPESRSEPEPSEIKSWNEAKSLRAELAALHQNFDKQFNENQKLVFEQHSTQLRRLRDELSKKAAQREQVALRKAENLARSRPVPKDFLSLIKHSPPEAPPSMSRHIELQFEQVAESSHFQQTPENRRPISNLLQAELNTWCRVKGYVFSSNPRGARDATQEFALWRKRFQVGR